MIGAGNEPRQRLSPLMSNGTSGDANCNDYNNPPRKFDRFTVGEDVAQAALAAYQGIQYHDWVPLAMVEQTLTLGIRQPTPDEVAAAREFLGASSTRRTGSRRPSRRSMPARRCSSTICRQRAN